MKSFEMLERAKSAELPPYGRNVEIHLVVGRHAKNPEQAQEWGEGYIPLSSVVKGYSSRADRAQVTIARVVDSVDASTFAQGYNKSVRDELNNINISDEMRDEVTRITKLNGYTEGIQYYLDHGHEDLQATDPVIAAAELAKRVDRFQRMPDRLRSNSRIEPIVITHGGKLEAFLREVLVITDEDGNSKTGFRHLDEIGGALRETENFELFIRTNEQGEKRVECLFRRKAYTLDQKRIIDLLALLPKAVEEGE